MVRSLEAEGLHLDFLNADYESPTSKSGTEILWVDSFAKITDVTLVAGQAKKWQLQLACILNGVSHSSAKSKCHEGCFEVKGMKKKEIVLALGQSPLRSSYSMMNILCLISTILGPLLCQRLIFASRRADRACSICDPSILLTWEPMILRQCKNAIAWLPWPGKQWSFLGKPVFPAFCLPSLSIQQIQIGYR